MKWGKDIVLKTPLNLLPFFITSFVKSKAKGKNYIY